MLILNLFLAVAWAAMAGQMTLANLLVGFLLGYSVLWISTRPLGRPKFFRRVGQVARLAIVFLGELFIATFRVAIDIVTPQHLMKPAILAIPINAKSHEEATTLANVVTLTPGTLSLDVSPDGKTLYVHAMYAADVDKARRDIQEGLGRRVKEVFE